MSGFHTPVMVQNSIGLLNLKSGGIYVDATTGGAGHSLAMLNANPDIRLFCFDQDSEALEEATKRISESGFGNRAEIIKANFVHLRTHLSYSKIKGIDGVLFDLGVSSHQLDAAQRGFSFDKPAPLDMRMDKDQEYSAYDAVNSLDTRSLTKIFRDYGEEMNAHRIAKAIEKTSKPIKTTTELAAIVESVVGRESKESLKSKVRIFQALRIYVNKELENLQTALTDTINLLNPGGRIVVLSYHSLEDRIVKQTFAWAAKGCICPPAIINCVCDHKRQLQVLTKSPVIAEETEIKDNPRARSAKLRAAEKTDEGTRISNNKGLALSSMGEQ